MSVVYIIFVAIGRVLDETVLDGMYYGRLHVPRLGSVVVHGLLIASTLSSPITEAVEGQWQVAMWGITQ